MIAIIDARPSGGREAEFLIVTSISRRAPLMWSVIWLLISIRLAYNLGTVKVRDVLKLLRNDGWRLMTTVGSHRQFKHPTKSGRVTVSGHTSEDVHPKNSRVS